MNSQEEITEFFSEDENPDSDTKDELRIVILVENTSCDENIIPEHGLAVYFEFNGLRGLYDTGQTDILLDNSAEMYIDLRKLDLIAISHGHYDHTGGLLPVLQRNPHAIPVYAGVGFCTPKFARRADNSIDNIGCPYSKANIEEEAKFLLEVSGKTEIAKDIFLIGPAPLHEKFEEPPKHMLLEAATGYANDLLADERTLVLRTSKGIVIISGCAHRGSVNITKDVSRYFPEEKIILLMGGFHLGKTDYNSIMQRISTLKEMNIGGIGLCHCTGAKACQLFKKEFAGRCFIAPAGSEIAI